VGYLPRYDETAFYLVAALCRAFSLAPQRRSPYQIVECVVFVCIVALPVDSDRLKTAVSPPQICSRTCEPVSRPDSSA
jgi:hypothetical protein